MKLRLVRLPALALLAVVALAAPTSAEDAPTVSSNAFVLSDVLDRERVDASLDANQAALQPAGPLVRLEESSRDATTYHPLREVSERALRQFAEWMSGLSRSRDGRRIAASMGERDPVRSWAKIVGDDGLKPGDMVDAVTSYWILNWAMANGAGSTRAEAQAVSRQVRWMIASPEPRLLREDQRQKISEVLMLNFLIQHAAYADAMARGDSETAGRLGEAAVSRFQTEMGLDLRELRLTDSGFVRG